MIWMVNTKDEQNLRLTLAFEFDHIYRSFLFHKELSRIWQDVAVTQTCPGMTSRQEKTVWSGCCSSHLDLKKI
jgi:hypothetical protein